MTKTEIRSIVTDYLQIKDFDDSTDLKEMGMESVQTVGLIVELETAFGIEVYDSDLNPANFRSVDAIYDTLQKYVKADVPLYKCVITDCDGVLWRGIAGESGEDRAYFDEGAIAFCETLHNLRSRGILLAACTRNERANVEVMLSSPESPLSPEDFVILEADCTDKTAAVGRILDEVGFYPENVVYIDDTDAELAVLAHHFPELCCVKADDDLAALFPNLPETTEIDRTAQFREQKEREKVHSCGVSPEEYNRILETEVNCSRVDETMAARLAELSQRANRFNMTGRRYDADELAERMKSDEITAYALRASDKFGDMGVVAMAVVDRDDVIESFILSCRVFGRDFEVMLLDEIKANAKNPVGIYVLTGKNETCRDFYETNGIPYNIKEENL